MKRTFETLKNNKMTKEKLTEIMYLFRDLWCQNIDISTIDEFIDDLAEREVKLFAIPDVSVQLPLTEARLSALHDIAKQYCYTTQDDTPTISRKGVELLLVEYSKGN